jgi:hypothetical protein
VRQLNMQRRIIGRFLKFRIIGFEERFVIREQLEKHGNNIRVIVYLPARRKEATDAMERTTLMAILVLCTSYSGRNIHHMLCIVSGPRIILTLMCQ